jgi:16S rRNA (guanine966-N2)-methyltransferase
MHAGVQSDLGFVHGFFGSCWANGSWRAHSAHVSPPQPASLRCGSSPRAGSKGRSVRPEESASSADDVDWTLGVVRAPRPKRGSIGGGRSVRVQGRGYRSKDYAPQPPGLRVTAGSARGRKLASPQVHLRPMMSRVREALFSMLDMMGAVPTDGVVLDLFAGSGSVGIEALSRGMQRAVFVDAAEDCVQTIRENLESCGFAESGIAICDRVERVLDAAVAANNGKHFELITVTPPYEEVDYGVLMSAITASECVGEGTFVVVEYPVELKSLPPAIGGRLVGLRNRRYGRTVLAVYACQPDVDLEPRPDEFVTIR